MALCHLKLAVFLRRKLTSIEGVAEFSVRLTQAQGLKNFSKMKERLNSSDQDISAHRKKTVTQKIPQRCLWN